MPPKQRDFALEYARRKARARAQGYRSFWEKRAAEERKPAPSYSDLSKREQTIWHRAFRALKEMEKGVSLSRAAKEEHTTPGMVRRYMADQIEQRGRRWVPSAGYLEKQGVPLYIITEEGDRAVNISDAATRSEYATYKNYVKGALRKDPDSILGLARFEGRTFTDAGGEKHPFITDRRLLRRLYDDGQLETQDLYVETAG